MKDRGQLYYETKHYNSGRSYDRTHELKDSTYLAYECAEKLHKKLDESVRSYVNGDIDSNALQKVCEKSIEASSILKEHRSFFGKIYENVIHAINKVASVFGKEQWIPSDLTDSLIIVNSFKEELSKLSNNQLVEDTEPEPPKPGEGLKP